MCGDRVHQRLLETVSSVAHLEETVAAGEIALSDDRFGTLSAIGEQNA